MPSRCLTCGWLLLALAVGPSGCRRADLPTTKFGGTWTTRIGARAFAVLVVTQTGDRVVGSLSLPDGFEVGQSGLHFSKISNHVTRRPIANAVVQGDRLHFLAVSPKNPKDTDAFDLILTAPEEGTFKFADAPFDPWTMKRSPRGTVVTVATDWEPTQSYSIDDNLPSSDEMRKIFEADQQPRQHWTSLSDAQRAAITRDDVERRRQTQQLLANGRLHTAEDFKQAAFIFQHGSTPEDFILAHTLAMVAVARGDAGALWIASATFDRYLHTVGKPQVYGTQFTSGPNGSVTQEPFDRDLISDALRRQLDVPPLAEQQKQFRSLSQ